MNEKEFVIPVGLILVAIALAFAAYLDGFDYRGIKIAFRIWLDTRLSDAKLGEVLCIGIMLIFANKMLK